MKREDADEARRLAEELAKSPSKAYRMKIQQAYVSKMTRKYNHERATQLLTQVWKIVDRIEKDKGDEAEVYV